MSEPVLQRGAEANVSMSTWSGRDVVLKDRVPKSYRHKVLDERLRMERTRDEANLLIQARQAGVPVPIVYEVHRAEARMVLQFIPGRSLRDALPGDSEEVAAARLRLLGALTGRLHDAGLTHGDLTTSNVLVPDAAPDGLVLIDFGLGQFSQEVEPRGVDLHLVEEALEATDARSDALMAAFLEGYVGCASAVPAVRRLDDIRQRGRYREAT